MAAINQRLAEEMQLQSRYPLTRRFTSKELHRKLETIVESTRLHYTMKHPDEPLSQDDLQCAVMANRIKPTYQWEAAYWGWAAYRQWEPTNVMKEVHLRRIKNPIYGAEQLHYPITYEELYNQITPKPENHCTMRSALLFKYVYRYITRMQRHLRVKRAYQDQEPTTENYCTLRTAFTVETFTFSKIDWDCGNYQEMIWDERYEMNFMHVVRKPSSGTYGLQNCNNGAHQRSGRPRSAFRNQCTGKGYDMNTSWYRATTIMRWEPGDTLIAEAMHDIMNTQLRQPEGTGVSSVMLSAANLVICLLAKRLPWLLLYE